MQWKNLGQLLQSISCITSYNHVGIISSFTWNFKAAEAIQGHIFHCHLIKYAPSHNSQFPSKKAWTHNFIKCLKIASFDLLCHLSVTEGIFRPRELGFTGSTMFIINYEREVLEGRKTLMRQLEKMISHKKLAIVSASTV